MPSKTIEPLTEEEAREQMLLIDQRDQEILVALDTMTFATSMHLGPLLGIHSSNVNRRVNRLCHHRYVKRMSQLGRHGAGAPRHVYTLDLLGWEYIAHLKGIRETPDPRSLQNHDPYAISQRLATADIYVALHVATRLAGIRFRWWGQGEAAHTWRLPSGQERRLEPAGIFQLEGLEAGETLAFLEVDRAFGSTQQWERVLEVYRHYFSAEDGFAARWKGELQRPRLLVIATVQTQTRLDSLLQVSEWKSQWGGNQVRLGLAVHDQIRHDTVLRLPWSSPGGSSFRFLENMPEAR